MSSPRPKILYLTPHWPHAPSYGSQIRALHIGRLLQQCGDVQLVLFQRPGSREYPGLDATRAEFGSEVILQVARKRIEGLRERLRHELDPWFINTDGWIPAAGEAERLQQLIAGHDLVWIHGLFTADNMGLARCRKAVLDIDDIFSQYYGSALRHSNTWTQRLRNARHLWLWKRRERILLQRFGVITVCSDDDRRYLGGDARLHTVPNGYGMSAEEPLERNLAEPPRIGFVGTLKYPPNRDGMRWFAEHVWPRIKQAHPSVRLRLVGAATDSLAGSFGQDVDGLGWVDDPAAEFATWNLSIVPVQVGGGTRIKIAEAFSRKCPVVATSWGAFGYDVKSGEELLLADGPEEFSRACLSLLQDTDAAQRMADCAWRKYARCWTWSAIGSNVTAAVEHCLSLSTVRSVKQAASEARAMRVPDYTSP